jgi:hypothetical protein
VELPSVVDPKQRVALIQHLEGSLATNSDLDAQRDLKLDVAQEELVSMIGDCSVSRLVELARHMFARLIDTGVDDASSARLKFKLRRRAAVEGTKYERIPFHRDYSHVVINVALNDDFDGARLIYAIGDELLLPRRAAGDATGHDCRIVHGVSRLASGVRYNLFVFFESL